RLISPWVRNSGGSPTRRCRSELLDCTRARSSLPSFCSAAWNSDDANSPGSSPGDDTGLSTMGAAAMTDARGAFGAGFATGCCGGGAGAWAAVGCGAGRLAVVSGLGEWATGEGAEEAGG